MWLSILESVLMLWNLRLSLGIRLSPYGLRSAGRPTRQASWWGVCYRPPNQDEDTDEEFYRLLAKVVKSSALVLMGDLNFPDVSWTCNTAQRKQSRRFLESVEDSFLTQLVSEPTGEVPH